MKGPGSLAASVCLALVLASSGESGVARGSSTPGPARGVSGVVSFQRDVAPVLVASCATGSCHGGGSRPPVLAARDGVGKLRVALVGVASEERPGRAYVHPGDPDASYLMQKIEGHLVDAECADRDCGEPMPLDNPSLSADARRTIRAWIAQGARDN